MIKYDWEKEPPYLDTWSEANITKGSIYVGTHATICALMEVNQSFKEGTYDSRMFRRQGFYDNYGRKKSMSPMTEEEIMVMDMDVIMSAVRHGKSVIIHTNDLEDERWLDLVSRCPVVKRLYTVPSIMEDQERDYFVTGWLFSVVAN